MCHATYSDCFYHFIPGVLYHVTYSYCFILPEVIAVYFNFNIDNCHARILQIVTYSISVWILLEDKNKLQLPLESVNAHGHPIAVVRTPCNLPASLSEVVRGTISTLNT